MSSGEKGEKRRDHMTGDSGKAFDNQTEQKGDDRHYYRNLILCSVAAFFAGMILKALLKAFGFGAFFLGLTFFGLGAIFGKRR